MKADLKARKWMHAFQRYYKAGLQIVVADHVLWISFLVVSTFVIPLDLVKHGITFDFGIPTSNVG